MNRQLLSFAIWVLAVPLLLAIFTLFQNPGPRPAATPAAQDGAQWLVSLVISWLPFFVLIGVWLFLTRWMRRGGYPASSMTPLSAKRLDDQAFWQACAKDARAVADGFSEAESKRQMLEIARGYEYLAQRAEDKRRAAGQMS
jgi:hypothetical protein